MVVANGTKETQQIPPEIVEKYLGVGKKVMDCSSKQSDQIALINEECRHKQIGYDENIAQEIKDIKVELVEKLTKDCGIDVPLFGMVKDDYHKTRALCTEHEEISIAQDRAVFTAIYRIQEEVHRYAIGYHRQLRQKKVTGSSLDSIESLLSQPDPV